MVPPELESGILKGGYLVWVGHHHTGQAGGPKSLPGGMDHLKLVVERNDLGKTFRSECSGRGCVVVHRLSSAARFEVPPGSLLGTACRR